MTNSNYSSPELEIKVVEDIDAESKLIIHNDNHNTFDWVIETLVKVCRHSAEQAEQCAYIIHNKGKYAVKHGTYLCLKPMKDAIADRGINVTIEK